MDSIEKHQEFPSSTIPLLVKKINRSVVGQDYVDWAVQALIEDFDSPSLAVLASLDLSNSFSLWEAEKYFQSAFSELGWVIPDDETALRAHLITLVNAIKDRSLDPEIGVDRIHREVVSPLMHPADLQGWCLLSEGNSPTGYERIPQEEYASRIVKYAEAWVTEKK